MATPNPRMDATAWAELLFLSVLWGASFLFIKVAVAEIPVFTLVLVRVALAALLLHGVIALSGRAYPPPGPIYGRYALMGLVNNAIPFTLIVVATARIGAGAASILNAAAPIFTLLVAHVLTHDEKRTAQKTLGVLVGLLGVVAMVGLTALEGLGGEAAAALAMLAATLSYGFSAVVGKSFRGIDPVISAACQLTASSIMLAPLAALLERPWTLPLPSLPTMAAALAFAVVSTALAYVLFFRLLVRAGGTNPMLVTLLIPVSGVALGALALGERFDAGEAAGMALIGAGLIILDGRAAALLKRRTAAPQA